MAARIRANKPLIGGTLAINTILVFVFGVIFLTTMLIFATQYPNPTAFQVQVFITTLGLSAAGIGAMLPGTLNVGHRPLFRATGATAMFAVVFFFQPKIADSVAQFVAPPESPEPIAAAYLSAVDDGSLQSAWNQIDPAAKGVIVDSLETMQRIYDSYRKPLGRVLRRDLAGMNSMQSPQGYPIGLYRSLSYRTKFGAAGTCRQEAVTLRATQDLRWRVFSHLIGPNSVEC